VLGEHICWPIMGADGMQHDLTSFDIVPEVVALDVDVLGAWLHLWDLSNFESATAVLENLTMDCWLG